MTAATNRPLPASPPLGFSGSRRELKFSLRETLQTPLSQSARFTDVMLILTVLGLVEAGRSQVMSI